MADETPSLDSRLDALEAHHEFIGRRFDGIEQMLAQLTQGMIECSIGVEVALDEVAAGKTDEERHALAQKLLDGKKQLFDVLKDWSHGLVDEMDQRTGSTAAGLADDE